MSRDERDKFEGAIHDEFSLDMGTNRDGRRVVRMVLNPSKTVSHVDILSLDAAVFIRDRLNQILSDAGLDGNELISGMYCPGVGCGGVLGSTVDTDGPHLVCPKCGLEWDEDAEPVAT